MRYLFCLGIGLLVSWWIYAGEPGQKGTFSLGKKEFLLNGKPYLIRAGEIHFPRIPREYWEHRIQMVKAMGMNTICIYLFWNFHEQTPDVFDFTGQKDVAEFVRLIQKHGMYAIVRPGPYACAEWDMGGLPWWLLKKKDLQVRTRHDAYFMERAKKYLSEVGKQLAPLQIQNGGNIIMVQVENEYAVFGDDAVYMTEIRDAIIDAGFDKVQLFRCDWSSTFYKYEVKNVATTLNFGAGSNVDEQFARFREMYPDAPLMCSEYWTGWFDYWGRPHETRSVESFIGSLHDMMERNISFSLYMAHGGTSFGQWGGANSPPFGCMVASYDYNAPINEAGQPTEKFYAVRKLLANYLNPGEILPDVPASLPMIEIPAMVFTESAPLFDNLPNPNRSEHIQPIEMFDQGWGRVLYRTTLPAYTPESRLVITEIRDWAVIYIDGKFAGKLDRRKDENTLVLPNYKDGAQLDILVEVMGRVNYGETIIDRKGITEKVEVITDGQSHLLKTWEVFNIPVDYPVQQSLTYSNKMPDGPAWYRAEFELTETGDTYLDVSTWGKGMVWVNGYNIGRYWNIGPQQTLFMPGCWLRKGRNEILVLDLEAPACAAISGVKVPVLDRIVPDQSMLRRKKGETLMLNTYLPIVTGAIPNGSQWVETSLPSRTRARYLCFEVTSAQDSGDEQGSIAEFMLIGSDGKALPRKNWKIRYASSEEITAANHSADKIIDNQESTFWHSAWLPVRTPQPHQIVIDLGEEVEIAGFRYMPRGDKNTGGKVKDFNLYLSLTDFVYRYE